MKALSHWLSVGLPLIIISPVVCIFLNMPISSIPITICSLILGTCSLTLIGMMGAAYISESLGLISSEVVNRQKLLLENFGLPIKILEKININLLLDIMQSDKKTVDNSINWVVLNNIGSASISNSVSREIVLLSLDKLIYTN